MTRKLHITLLLLLATALVLGTLVACGDEPLPESNAALFDLDGDGVPNDQDDDIDGDGVPNDQDDDNDTDDDTASP